MTDITFHVNVPDLLGYACRLLRKAVRREARVVVAAPARLLAQLDRQLWVFEPLEFVPHVLAKPGQSLAPRLQDTPVWLTDAPLEAPHHDVLLHLGDAPVEGFERFARVIELVPAEGPGLQAGRVRWRHYAERGFQPQKHDLAGETTA
jgi:DNA polymerase III subunit chi